MNIKCNFQCGAKGKNLEGDIKGKLLETEKESYSLPESWDIPLTTQKYEFRPPLVLNKYAMNKPLVIIPPNNLGQNGIVSKYTNITVNKNHYNSRKNKSNPASENR